MDLDIGHRVAMVAAASKGLGKASALATFESSEDKPQPAETDHVD